MLPLDKLLDSLRLIDEVQLIELLDLKTYEILERFEDRVKERYAYIAKEIEEGAEAFVELNFV